MGSFKVRLVGWFVVLAMLPLAFGLYGYATLAGRSETRRADAALEAELRAASASYAARVDATVGEAHRLASEPSVAEALGAEDLVALNRLLPPPPAGPAVAERAAVIEGGHELGIVTAWLPIDGKLLRAVGSGLGRQDRLVAVQDGRIVAGPGAGERFAVSPGRTRRVHVDGTSYRALAAAPIAGFTLAALTPQSAIDSATASAERRAAAVLLIALAALAIATYLIGRSIVGTLRRLAGAANAIASGSLDERVEVSGNDEFAQVGRAFNHMAGELQRRLEELEEERLRVQRAVARFGEALGATHDTAQLLRVVVESAVEAAGATGGVVRGGDGELVRAGDPDAGTERTTFPLRDFGELVLSSAQPFDPAQTDAVTSLATQGAIALENVRLHRIVEREALFDGLTGLANRRGGEEALRTELARAARFGGRSCIVMADLDEFKRVNDRHGHAYGDDVLRQFAATLHETVRESDTAIRWGGEEFALVLSGTDADGGMHLAERARAAFEARGLGVTASFGVASYPEHGNELSLVAAADAALYEAKRAGRNRVLRASASVPEEMV